MRLAGLLLVLASVSACERTYVINPDSQQQKNPLSPTPPTTTLTRIEYRVSGNAASVRVRYSNPRDGLIQVVTALPFIAQVNVTDETFFVSLEVTPLSYPFNVTNPFTSAQLFVAGVMFREAAATDFSLAPIFVSGTYRR